jgi:hypothetical protein
MGEDKGKGRKTDLYLRIFLATAYLHYDNSLTVNSLPDAFRLGHPDFHYIVHKSPQLELVGSQIIPVHTFTFRFLKILSRV